MPLHIIQWLGIIKSDEGMREQLILIYSYLHGIWQYRWMALLISFVITVMGLLIVYSMPNKYTAQAVVHVDTTSVMTPLLKGLSVESEKDAGLNIMTRMLLSRKNLEDVVRQTDMDLKVNTPEALDKLILNLSRSVELKLAGKRQAGIYELSYTGKSPELVYKVISKLLNTLIENTLESARTDTASAQLFIDRQINEYEIRLTSAEQKLAAFKRANVGFMPDKTGGYYNRLQNEESKLYGIKSKLKLMQRKYSTMLKQLEGELPLLDSSYGAPKVLKLRQYQGQLDDLLTQYQEQHPDVLSLRVSIAEIIASESKGGDKFVNVGGGDSIAFNPVYQELKADINRTSIEVEALTIMHAEQKSNVQALKQAVDIIPGVEAELAKLNRDYEITRERYLSFVKRREAARLAQAVGQSGNSIKFRIIEPPRVPTEPSGPKRLLFLAAVFIVAVAAGLGWGVLNYLLKPTFIDSSQLRDKLGLPVLGSVGYHFNGGAKKERQVQLASFVAVLFLLVVVYGAAMIFHDPGSRLVNALIESRSL